MLPSAQSPYWTQLEGKAMFLHTLRAVVVIGLLAITPMFATFATAQTAGPIQENQRTGPTKEEVELELKLALLRGQAEPMIAYHMEMVRPFIQDLQMPFDEEFFKKKLAESGIPADDPRVAKIEREAREYYAERQAEMRKRIATLIEQVALLEASVRGYYAMAERALTLAVALDPENSVYQAELEAVRHLRALHRQGQSEP